MKRYMIDYGLRMIPLIDEKTFRVQGIVHRHNLLSLTSGRLYGKPVKTIAEEPRIVVTVEDKLLTTIKHMFSIDEWYTVVLTKELSYSGVLGLEHIIRYMLDNVKLRKLLSVPVDQVMTRNVYSVSRYEPVYRAWQIMLSHRLAALPVIDNKGVIVGVIAEYDLLKHGFTRPKLESDKPPLRGPPVGEIMSTPAVTVRLNDPVIEAAKLIVKRGIGRVYVVGDNGELKGVVDREDIVKLLIQPAFQ